MVEPAVLMGHAPAKVDDKGRLKIPAGFRKVIEERYGADCFITSTDGERAVIYPMPVWYDFQGRMTKVPSTSQAKAKLLERVNYCSSRPCSATWPASPTTWWSSATPTTSSSGTRSGSRSGSAITR
jgi:bifunctional DNA-binding transcriptional regulator/antitoxin component of YhaV-PrlF toxin-antitoxin module